MDQITQEQLPNIDITDFTLYATSMAMRMGLEPKTSVVNSLGEAHFCKGLYISDASVSNQSGVVSVNIAVSHKMHNL